MVVLVVVVANDALGGTMSLMGVSVHVLAMGYVLNIWGAMSVPELMTVVSWLHVALCGPEVWLCVFRCSRLVAVTVNHNAASSF